LPLPQAGFDACRKQPAMARSFSLVRFEENDYSVPVDYAHHEIRVKGYVECVDLCDWEKVVAQHRRSWPQEGVFFDYLALLKPKPGSLDYARTLTELRPSESFDMLRRQLRVEEVTEPEV
jgi:hypothetical protein